MWFYAACSCFAPEQSDFRILFISACHRFLLLPLLRKGPGVHAHTVCVQVFPSGDVAQPGFAKRALFYLDKGYITKVKVSVRNYTSKICSRGKGFSAPLPLAGTSATASLYRSRRIAMPRLASCRLIVFAVVILLLGLPTFVRAQKDAGRSTLPPSALQNLDS